MSDMTDQIAGMSRERLALLARRMQEHLEEVESRRREPIAIIGIGCRLPGAAGPEALWRLLDSGGDAITEVPAQRWNKAAYYHPDPDHPGTTYCWHGGFLDGIENFDPGFFGISPRESKRMDPQQKLLLEVIWETLEHAGLAPSSLVETLTGVFVGISTNDFLQIGCRNAPIDHIDAYFGTGSAASIAAGRISYILGFQGPNYPIDTACSSSLVAVHAACQSLQNRESHVAVAAGVNLMLAPETTIYFSKVRALSMDGRCKTFDATANGYVRSEGCAAIVLKRLSDAERHGDRILAIIRGSAVNHDGATSGLTVPNGLSQEKVLRAALASASLSPDAIDYIEAHGTGTSLGDPIEIQALGAVYGKRPSEHSLLVGSVKTNIGHTEATAGLASLLKVVLALQHQKIPSHLHYQTPNPYIPWERYPIRITSMAVPWPISANRPRIAGISAFGFSGTNAHVLVAEAPEATNTGSGLAGWPCAETAEVLSSDSEESATHSSLAAQTASAEPYPDRPLHLLCTSGKTRPALQASIERLLDHLKRSSTDRLADITYSTNKGRDHFPYRACIIARTRSEAIRGLEEFAANPPEWIACPKPPKIAFLYSGQGSGYIGMGRELFHTQPIFRAAMEECDTFLGDTLQPGLLDALYHLDSDHSPLNQTRWTQPALFALQYALTLLWRSWGIEPAIVLGHSIGEYAAAWAAGLFTWQDGLRLAACRGALLQSMDTPGMMVATLLSEDQIGSLIHEFSDRVSLAAVNGPHNTVISGAVDAMEILCQQLDDRGVSWKRLDVSGAFHSPLTESILPQFSAEAEKVTYNGLRVGLISSVTGKLASGEQVGCASYWRDHIRHPVQFAGGIRTLFERAYQVFVEIGPQATLCGLGKAIDLFESNGSSTRRWLPSLRRGSAKRHGGKITSPPGTGHPSSHIGGDWRQVTETLRELYLIGHSIDWASFDAPYHRQLISLPTYPFQRRRDVLDIDPELLKHARSILPEIPSQQIPSDSSHGSVQDKRLLSESAAVPLDASRVDVSPADASDLSPQNRLYEIRWIESPSPTPAKPVAESGQWILIANENELVKTFMARLEAKGRYCHLVIPGKCLARIDRNRWTIRMQECDEWRELLSEVTDLSESVGGLEGIIFLRSADTTPATGSLESLHAAQQQGLRAVLHLTQALIEASVTTVRLLLVTRGTQCVVSTDRCEGLPHAPLWGFSRTVAIERPQLQCTRIDLPWCDTPDIELEVNHLLDASFSDDREDQIAVRGTQRHVARLARWEPESSGISDNIKSDATYWITGGSGGIGLLLARWLISRGARHLVLSGRRELDHDLQETLTTLGINGIQIDYRQCDVSDGESVKALVESIDIENRPLAGIFHLAGVLDDGFLPELTWPRFEALFRPKLDGAWHIHEQTTDRPLDFVCFFSSIASQLGSPKQANYAAANAFLDGLATYRRARGFSATSICWGPWAEAGMAARIGLDQPQNWRTFGIQPLATQDGFALMEKALSNDRAVCGAMRMDWGRFFQLFPPGLEPPLVADLADGRRRLPPPSKQWLQLVQDVQTVPEGERRGRVLEYVHEHLTRILGIDATERIDPDAGFFDLGMDSLMAVEMHAALQADLGDFKVLPITFAFSRPTIHAVTDFLLQEIESFRGTRPQEAQGHRKPGSSTISDHDEPIAVIGMACRFPGSANDPTSFWRDLASGKDAIIEVPSERWDIDAVYDPNPDAIGKMNTRWGGFIDHVDSFDAAFFGISPREALSMDPQHRILLETSYEALENSQLDAKRLSGSRTGIFIGISGNDYLAVMRRSNNPNLIDGYLATGNTLSIAAGRIAHVLGFQGPCLAIDTACSSSLVAVHLACESLRSGESDTALAGGVNLILTPDVNVALSKARAISPEGRCKTFDALADGYVRGEGCGIVVLKRLSQAQEDGDPIWGVIRSSAVNHDGRSGGLTVPNGESQQALLREALRRAGLTPDAIDYVEAHGTGTPLGDPIELAALGQVYQQQPWMGGCADPGTTPRRSPLLVGSVKTNLGHLEAAAGVAGLIKTLLALHHELIPPHLHFRLPNPNIDWQTLPIEVPSQGRHWKRNSRPRIAGVSSFGFSGTNAHLLVEEAPFPTRPETGPNGTDISVRGAPHPEQWLCLSAKSESALAALAARYRDYLKSVPADDWPSICHAANAGRSHYDYRLTVQADSAEQAAAELARYCDEGKTSPRLRTARIPTGRGPQIAMLFTGQGGDLANLGKDLFGTEPTFRAILEDCDTIFRDLRGISLLDKMHGDSSALLQRAEFAQPALYALQMGLARLWGQWGVHPSSLFGHSTGHFAAACVAGVFSLEEGMRLITERGRLMQQVSGDGAMITASLEPARAAEYLDGTDVALAAVNGPRLVTLSGSRDSIEMVVRKLAADQIPIQRLNVTCGYHSPMLDPILDELRTAASQVHYHAPSLGLLCNLTGNYVATDEVTSAEYWVRIAREPVQFLAAMHTLQQRGYNTFLEIGPQPTLLALGRQILGMDCQSMLWLPSLRPEKRAWKTMLDSASALYRAGQMFDFQMLYPGADRRRVHPPNYPFQRQRYWIDAGDGSASDDGSIPVATGDHQRGRPRHALVDEHPLLGVRFQSPALSGHVFQREFSPDSPEYLKDHAIYSFVIVPGASHLAMVLCAAERLQWGTPTLLADISFPEALILPEDEPRTVQLILSTIENGARTFRVMSSEARKETDWVTHAVGRIRNASPTNEGADMLGAVFSTARAEDGSMSDLLRAEIDIPDIETVQARCSQHVEDASIFYVYMARGGVELGPSFQWLAQLWRRDGEALARLASPLDQEQLAPYPLHPGLIDSCIQLVAAGIAQESHDYYAYIPVSADRFRFHRPPRGPLWAHVVHRKSDGSMEGAYLSDLCLFDQEGMVAEILCIRLQRAPRAALKAFAQRKVRQWTYRLHWSSTATPSLKPAFAAGEWLLFADNNGLGERLATELVNQGRRAVLVSAGNTYRQIDSTHYQINPAVPEHYKHVLRDGLSSERAIWAGVIHLWATSSPQVSATDDPDPVTAFQNGQLWGSRSILSLVQALSEQTRSAAPRLWLLTRGAVAVDEEPEPGPIHLAQAPIWGMGRVIAIELPQFRCVRIDLDPSGDVELEASHLACELRSEEREDQVAYRHDVRYIPRLVRGSKGGGPVSGDQQEDGRSYQLVRPATRVIDQLAWRPMARIKAGPGEIEIAVRATGLNFRDVLNALNLYPGDAGPLGFECAGTVTDAGPGVTEYRPGDRVVAISPGCFSRYTVADCRLVAPIPENISLNEAATIPIVFLTAEIGLEEMARLQPGEWVLIHSAAGGVGMAAIQIAKKIGATMIATAGSEEKRAYVRSLGVEYVFNSRSLDFAQHVQEVTDGHGVDVVINALPGDYVAKNIEALAKGGRFIEIGKSDLWNAQKVAEVRGDIHYQTLALDQLVLQQLDRVGQQLRAVMQRFQDGLYQPLPETVFPREEVKDAFRYMAQAKHIGKVVVSHPELSSRLDRDEGKLIHAQATYLITGGLGGLGLLVSQWLVNQGAKSIVLVGRRPPGESAATQIESMRDQGADIRVLQADVSRRDDIRRVFEVIDTQMPPLRGVVHAAGTLDDGVLIRQDWSRFETVFAPKAWGALHLDHLCRGRALDWFVMFSSAASLLGGPGQGNYAAANAVLDALAHERHRRGEPAMSINWGPWSGAGMATRSQPATERQWQAKGIGMISPNQGMATLATLLAEPACQVGVLPIDWSVLIQNFPPGTEPPLIAHLATARRQSLEPNKEWLAFVEELKKAPPAERQDMLVRHIQMEAARVMGHPSPDMIDPKAPLTELGFDSLMAVEMVNQLSAAAGISLPTTLLFDYPNLEAIAGYIVQHVLNLDLGDLPKKRAKETELKQEIIETTESLLASIEELSDEEVSAELERTRKP